MEIRISLLDGALMEAIYVDSSLTSKLTSIKQPLKRGEGISDPPAFLFLFPPTTTSVAQRTGVQRCQARPLVKEQGIPHGPKPRPPLVEASNVIPAC